MIFTLAIFLLRGSSIVMDAGSPRTITEATRETWEFGAPRLAWTNANHNAFPAIARWNGAYYLALNEASGHTATNHRMRIISSVDGINWSSFYYPDIPAGYSKVLHGDIIAPSAGGLAMICSAISNTTDTVITYRTIDGTNWTQALGPSVRPWQVEERSGTYYLSAYRGNPYFAEIYTSSDFTNWALSGQIHTNFASETAITWIGETMHAVVRGDNNSVANTNIHHRATSSAPYSSWTVTTNQYGHVPGARIRTFDGWGRVMCSRESLVAPWCQGIASLEDSGMIFRRWAGFADAQDGGYGDFVAVDERSGLAVTYYGSTGFGDGTTNAAQIWVWEVTR